MEFQKPAHNRAQAFATNVPNGEEGVAIICIPWLTTAFVVLLDRDFKQRILHARSD